jgi:hypothetical protein
MNIKSSSLNDLLQIPGVGPRIAEDLQILGIRSVTDLIGKNPEVLYKQLCVEAGQKLDRCILYVFRCAVYFASHENHNPELLKWWNWSDQKKSLHH